MSEAINATRHWVEQLVVGLNLCPFAKRELVKDRVRFVEQDSASLEALLETLETELTTLRNDDSIETTLVVVSGQLQDFDDYLDTLSLAEQLVSMMGMVGEFQIASFHPDYQFDGTDVEDAENYTNRAPYPTFHLLREASLEEAIEKYPDTAEIPDNNVALMQSMGVDRIKAMLKQP